MNKNSSTEAWVSVVIVNYGTAELTAEAVDSVLRKEHDGLTVDVHLVDNRSPQNDGPRLQKIHKEREWGKQVTLYLEETNHGFGRGNNVALNALAAREVPPSAVFLLNPDAQLDNEVIAILFEALQSNASIGAAGAAICLPDQTPTTAAFRFPTLPAEFEKAANFGPISRMLASSRIAYPASVPQQSVDWVAGAAVMFRFSALEKVGFFDPAYFLYYEEVDLMHALSKDGWSTLYVPTARAVHHEGAATGVSPESAHRRRPPYLYQSWRYYFSKNRGRGYSILTCLAVILGASLNTVIAGIRRRPRWLPAHFIRDHTRHVLIPLIFKRDVRPDA